MARHDAIAASIESPATSTRRPLTRTEFALFVCVPLVFTAAAAAVFRSTHLFAVNFHNEFWPAGSRVLHGMSPYVMGRGQVAAGLAFPYPAFAALFFAPFALVSRGLGDVAFTVACLLAAAGTLRVLEVRDWRLYGLVFLWAPVVTAWQTANLSLLLCLGVALLWRYRNTPAVAGLIGAVVVSLKPFVWPVGLWLLATRRYRAAGWGVAIGAAINTVAWAVLGFGEVSRYLSDASKVSTYFYRHAYTLVALVVHSGVGRTAASTAGVVLAAAVALVCVLCGRRGQDLRALALCVALMLLATPVQWMHYFVLVLVPLAIARPRMHWAWWLPVAMLVVSSSSPAAWQIAVALGVIAVVFHAILRRPDDRRPGLRRATGRGRGRNEAVEAVGAT
jgi:hypothetical protein